MEKKYVWLAIGYLVGSFFGVSSLFAMFSGAGAAKK